MVTSKSVLLWCVYVCMHNWMMLHCLSVLTYVHSPWVQTHVGADVVGHYRTHPLISRVQCADKTITRVCRILCVCADSQTFHPTQVRTMPLYSQHTIPSDSEYMYQRVVHCLNFPTAYTTQRIVHGQQTVNTKSLLRSYQLHHRTHTAIGMLLV